MTTYHTDIDLTNPNSSHTLVADLVARAPRVLDVGCATGYLAAELTALGSRVTGVEVDPEAAARAAEMLERVVVADLDGERLSDRFEPGSFDVVVFADVLEHVRAPEAVLADAVTLLAPGGRVVVSIPNISHGAIRLALAQGRWRYQDTGILDRTHLTFYTRSGVLDLLHGAGLEVDALRATVADPLAVPVDVDPEALPPGLVEWVRHQPDALCYQFVASAGRRTGEGPARVPELVPALPLSSVRRTDTYTQDQVASRDEEHRRLVDRDRVLGSEAEVAAARALADQARAEAATWRRRSARAREEAEQLRAEVERLRQSRTWRAGRAVTAPVRLVRRVRRS